MKNAEALRQFIEKLQWLQEPEFGDFRRKLGLYIDRLAGELGTSDAEVKQFLHKIRREVVFEPSGDIETTRRKSLMYSQELLQRLKSH